MDNNLYINKKIRISEVRMLEKYFDKLWPLNRSLTGRDVRKTHKILKNLIPLKTYEIKSYTKVHDWQVPLEWNVKKAYIKNLKGKKIIDFSKNNLHLASYSCSFKGIIKFNELKKKLYYIKSLPSAIPYKTTYYKKDWAFCLSYRDFNKLKEDKYFVEVDTSLKKGSMTISDYYISGKSKKEILVHAYTCHPSMANNEISGPLVASFLARRIKNNFFSYRFVFGPETIGSIVYLSKFGDHLKKNLIAGYICTCTGIKNFVTYKKSKIGTSSADKSAIKVIRKLKYSIKKIKNFSPTGSDERQYCSIGYNLPVGSIMSKPYGEYLEYHTSMDNKKIISFKHMQKIIDIYYKVFCDLEKNKDNLKTKNNKKITAKYKKKNVYPINLKIYGEPMISKYNIHYGVKNHFKADDFTMAIKWLIHYSDGNYNVKQISKMSKLSQSIINFALEKLCRSKIFKKIIK